MHGPASHSVRSRTSTSAAPCCDLGHRLGGARPTGTCRGRPCQACTLCDGAGLHGTGARAPRGHAARHRRARRSPAGAGTPSPAPSARRTRTRPRTYVGPVELGDAQRHDVQRHEGRVGDVPATRTRRRCGRRGRRAPQRRGRTRPRQGGLGDHEAETSDSAARAATCALTIVHVERAHRLDQLLERGGRKRAGLAVDEDAVAERHERRDRGDLRRRRPAPARPRCRPCRTRCRGGPRRPSRTRGRRRGTGRTTRPRSPRA